MVHGSTEKRAFMTLAFTTFDLERGVIRHTNAGHLYPYLLRNGQPPTSIELPSLPLGVRPKIRTRTVEVSLEEGDTLVYLSDGIIEAQNEHGDPFGFEQLEALLKQAEDTSPNTVRDVKKGVSGTSAFCFLPSACNKLCHIRAADKRSGEDRVKSQRFADRAILVED
ncbi:MAG: hypothetical protein DMF59_11160 [Acidobacteria bacterium]|nr:MAG: hypothetical protein DMF59_11160 [Acidobacteriota bacterium]